MSRFVYKLYHEEKLIGDYTSINHILMHNEFPVDIQQNIKEAFKLSSFTKRIPQVFVDEKHKIKIESSYLVFTDKIPLSF